MQVLEPLNDIFKLEPVLASMCPLTSIIDEEICKVLIWLACCMADEPQHLLADCNLRWARSRRALQRHGP